MRNVAGHSVRSSSPHRDRRRIRVPGALIAAVAALSLSGCIIPVPGDDALDIEFMTRDELQDYSERVFRAHNRTVTRLMTALSAADLSAREADRLERLERRMNRACKSLNRIASMRARDEEPDLELENRVRRDVRSCDERTRRVESLLDELDVGDGIAPAASALGQVRNRPSP
ncbi:MAG: hypothetical protein ACNS61_00965 [Candidatus Wenzhouxiangella sp. M2_3B_020]